MGRDNCDATSNNMMLIHWPLMDGLFHLIQRGGGANGRPLIAVANITAHSSMASVPIIVLLHNDLLLCRFHVPGKGLTGHSLDKTEKYGNTIIYTTVIHCVSKNVPSLTGYSFNTHPPIFTIFGTCHQQRFKNR